MKNGSTEEDSQAINVFEKWKRVTFGFILTTGALVVGLGILSMSFLVSSESIMATPVRAETEIIVETGNEAETVTIEVATAEAEMEKSEYYLPYPGVLPDNPLYKLKVIRDRLCIWFEPNEEQKAWKELGLSNKRINAARFLAEGGKLSLGVTTATKAEKYLEQAMIRTEKLNNLDKDVKSLMLELTKAGQKHLEILEELRARVVEEEMKSIELSQATTSLHLERLSQMLLEAK